MPLSRRDFLKYCGVSAALLGLSSSDLARLEEALANTGGPTVLWLQGAACTGCSMSFLNRISTSSPMTAADVLINSINLVYHPNIMAMAGQGAAAVVEDAYNAGGYILAVEGGVPTAFGGRTCWAWTYNGVDVTFQQAVMDLASRAAKILCVGTCASFGGIPAAGPNPTQIRSVSAATGKSTINIAGCPANPDWIVYPIAQLLLNQSLPLDASGRPTAIYGNTVHSACPRRNTPNNCLAPKGCRGPGVYGNCPTNMWNNGNNWCVNANAPCYACTEPTFPGTASLYTMMYNPHGTTNLHCGRCHDDEGD
jgi:NiFe hydrogenase small subunit HydA